MCIRYDVANDQLVKWSQAIGAWVPLEDWEQGRDTFPGYEAPLVIFEGPKKQLVVGQWGLIPSWTDDPGFSKKWHTYNARSEGNEKNRGIETAPSFREAFAKRRCIVPVSGFYEQQNGHWQRITIEGQEVFGIAGLWEPAKFSNKLTYTMVTTEPNSVIERVQDRMPVILNPQDYEAWLSLETPLPDLKALMIPYPPELTQIEQREPTSNKKAKIIEQPASLFDDFEN